MADQETRPGLTKGALGPVETAFNGVKTGLAGSFGELPSGGVRRLRDTIGTHNSAPIARLTGDVVDTSRPKVAARQMGRTESLKREIITRLNGKSIQGSANHHSETWGLEALGPDVENQAEQLTPEDPMKRWLTEDGSITIGAATHGITLGSSYEAPFLPIAPFGVREIVSAEALAAREMVDSEEDGLEAFEAELTARDLKE